MVIKCTDEGKMCAVLEKLQAETDIEWYGGEKIGEYEVDPTSYPVWLCIDEVTRQLTWTMREDSTKHYAQYYGDEIKDSEYLEIDMTLSEPQSDPVNHPSHYTQGKVECIDAMEEALGTEVVKGFCLGNTYKYLWRHADKNGDEDIKKAVWYFSRYKQILNR